MKMENGVFFTANVTSMTSLSLKAKNKSEACAFFFEYMTTRILHTHLVGYFIWLNNSEALAEKLAQQGIPTHRNDIPIMAKTTTFSCVRNG